MYCFKQTPCLFNLRHHMYIFNFSMRGYKKVESETGSVIAFCHNKLLALTFVRKRKKKNLFSVYLFLDWEKVNYETFLYFVFYKFL